ncbi:AroM family protein [Candidatus Thorarchaeota archaeon]|nr:MAG: AroM family protein [Candidatus Thorarchaeota archaeon]
MKKVAMITIGQSPRTDVMTDVEPILGSSIETIHCGALDDLSLEEIRALEPSPGEELLVTRLTDGTEVKLGHSKIVGKMNQCIQNLEPEVDFIAILCTGEFPELQSKKIMLKPSELMGQLLEGILQSGKLGVLIPNPEQKKVVTEKWKRENLEVFVQDLSPYQEQDMNEIERIAERFRNEGVDLIALDCIGYSDELSDFMKREVGVPALLSRTILARVIRELL